VRESVKSRQPAVKRSPASPFSRGIGRIAERLLRLKEMPAPVLFEVDEDLDTLAAEAPER
jgi:MinD-like ATPase involved in chromosome partitioning or flagellar assembly